MKDRRAVAVLGVDRLIRRSPHEHLRVLGYLSCHDREILSLSHSLTQCISSNLQCCSVFSRSLWLSLARDRTMNLPTGERTCPIHKTAVVSFSSSSSRESGSLARATSLRSLQHGIQVLVDHLVGPRLALKYVPTREPCRVAAAFRERQQHVGIRSHGCFVGQRLRRAHGVVEGVERQQRRADGGQLVDRGRALIVVLDRIELRAQGKVRELVS